MPGFLLSTILVALTTTPFATATPTPNYTLKTDLSYKDFWKHFDLYSEADPTNGFVQYQNLSSAISQHLIGYIDGSVFLGVDYTTSDPKGRASVRAESKINFNNGILIADIKHMPASVCGTWSAFWLLGEGTWPQKGEIDILEGVNDEERNAVTLHTTTGCVVSNATMGGMGNSEPQEFMGNMATDDCDVAAKGQEKNVGCSIKAPASIEGEEEKLPSYGDAFNKAGGGVYALEWTNTFIQAWFFPRGSKDFPDEKQLTESPDPSKWGKPIARFQGEGCDFAERFKDQRIIFNVAFCGDWAGAENVWGESCAKKTKTEKCADYVRDNPKAFEEVYWEIAGLRWFHDLDMEELKQGTRGVVHRRGRRYHW